MGFSESLHRADNALPWRSKDPNSDQEMKFDFHGPLLTPTQPTHHEVSYLRASSSLEHILPQHAGAPVASSLGVGRVHMIVAYRKPVRNI